MSHCFFLQSFGGLGERVGACGSVFGVVGKVGSDFWWIFGVWKGKVGWGTSKDLHLHGIPKVRGIGWLDGGWEVWSWVCVDGCSGEYF